MIPGRSSQLDENMSFVWGDQWAGIPAISITEAGSPPASDAASVVMQFRTQPTSPTVAAELSSAAGEITITSANGWTFSIPAQPLNLRPGTYHWSFRTTNVAGAIRTYLEGTVKVLQPVTRT